MRCEEARAQFSDWADGALGAEVRAALDGHLEGCAECRRELDRFGQTVALLLQAPRPRAPAGFVDRVLAALPVPWYRRLGAGLARFPLLRPTGAAAVVLVAALAVYVFQRSPDLQQAAREQPPAAMRAEPVRDAEAPAAAPAERPLEMKAEPQVAPAQPPEAPAPAPAAPPSDRPAAEAKEEKAAGPRRRLDVAEERQALRSASPGPTVMGTPVPAHVVGRLLVADRAAAEREIVRILARLGGLATSHRDETGASIVEATVPRAGYAELLRDLGRLGTWQPEAEPAALPARVAITLRITTP